MQQLFTQSEPSRHDTRMLTQRAVPADPYAMWVDKREAERQTPVAELTTPYGRFMRGEPMAWVTNLAPR